MSTVEAQQQQIPEGLGCLRILFSTKFSRVQESYRTRGGENRTISRSKKPEWISRWTRMEEQIMHIKKLNRETIVEGRTPGRATSGP